MWHLLVIWKNIGILFKPNPNKIVAEENISNQGFEVYLPKFKLDGGYKPLFPGYVFAHLAQDINWTPIFSTKGVARFVKFGSEFAIVPEHIINLIMKNEQQTIDQAIELSKFQKGDKLTVTSGPLAGFDVTFEKYTSDERIIVLFKMLQHSQSVSVEKDQVIAQ